MGEATHSKLKLSMMCKFKRLSKRSWVSTAPCPPPSPFLVASLSSSAGVRGNERKEKVFSKDRSIYNIFLLNIASDANTSSEKKYIDIYSFFISTYIKSFLFLRQACKIDPRAINS